MCSRHSTRLCLGAVLVLLATSAAAELCTAGRNTEVRWKGDWYKAKITQAAADKCKVTYIGYGAEDDEWVGPNRMRIKVLWKGDWYPAQVLKESNDGYLVHYEGYKSDDDEVVPLSRIQVR